MKESREEEFRKIIKAAIEPVGEPELKKDLWRQAEVKLPQTGISVPAFDWVLAALVVILSLLAPEAFLGLLSHL